MHICWLAGHFVERVHARLVACARARRTRARPSAVPPSRPEHRADLGRGRAGRARGPGARRASSTVARSASRWAAAQSAAGPPALRRAAAAACRGPSAPGSGGAGRRWGHGAISSRVCSVGVSDYARRRRCAAACTSAAAGRAGCAGSSGRRRRAARGRPRSVTSRHSRAAGRGSAVLGSSAATHDRHRRRQLRGRWGRPAASSEVAVGGRAVVPVGGADVPGAAAASSSPSAV